VAPGDRQAGPDADHHQAAGAMADAINLALLSS
jgi:hypothetical protein